MEATLETREVFLSYSSRVDSRVARRLEAYLESLHLQSWMAKHNLPKLEVFRDSSDFGHPEDPSASLDLEQQLGERIDRCADFLVLCSYDTPNHPWIDWELRRFTFRSEGWTRVFPVVTDSIDRRVFSSLMVENGFLDRLKFDLRRLRRLFRFSEWADRVEGEVLLELAAHLHGRRASDFLPSWQAERLERQRIRILVFAAVIVLVTLLASVAGWKWWQARDRLIRAEDTMAMRGYEAAIREGDRTSAAILLRSVQRPEQTSGWKTRAARALLQPLPTWQAEGELLGVDWSSRRVCVWDWNKGVAPRVESLGSKPTALELGGVSDAPAGGRIFTRPALWSPSGRFLWVPCGMYSSGLWDLEHPERPLLMKDHTTEAMFLRGDDLLIADEQYVEYWSPRESAAPYARIELPHVIFDMRESQRQEFDAEVLQIEDSWRVFGVARGGREPILPAVPGEFVGSATAPLGAVIRTRAVRSESGRELEVEYCSPNCDVASPEAYSVPLDREIGIHVSDVKFPNDGRRHILVPLEKRLVCIDRKAEGGNCRDLFSDVSPPEGAYHVLVASNSEVIVVIDERQVRSIDLGSPAASLARLSAVPVVIADSLGYESSKLSSNGEALEFQGAVIDVARDRCLYDGRRLLSPTASCLGFSPTGRFAAVSSADHAHSDRIALVDLWSLRRTTCFDHPHDDHLVLRWDAGETHLLVSGGGLVREWRTDASTTQVGSRSWDWPIYLSPMKSLCFLVGGVPFSGGLCRIEGWNLEAGTMCFACEVGHRVDLVRWLPQEEVALAVSHDGHESKIEFSRGEVWGRVHDMPDYPGTVADVSIDGETVLLVDSTGASVCVGSDRLIAPLDVDGALWGGGLNDRGDRCAILHLPVRGMTSVDLFELSNPLHPKKLRTWVVRSMSLSNVAVDGVGRVVAYGLAGLWLLSSCSDEAMEVPGEFGYCRRIAFGPKGTRMLALMHDSECLVWDLDSLDRPVLTLSGFPEGLRFADFLEDDDSVLTVDGTGEVRHWQCNAPWILRELEEAGPLELTPAQRSRYLGIEGDELPAPGFDR